MTPKKGFYSLLIGSFVLIALIAAGYYFTRQQLKSKSTDLSHLKAELDVLDERIIGAQKAINQYKELSFIDDVASSVLPPDKIQSNLVGELYALSAESSVSIRSLSFQSSGGQQISDPDLTQTSPLEGVNGVFSLPIDIDYTSGSYNSMLIFLEKLESNRRKFQVSRINISPIIETIPGTILTRITGYQGQIQTNVYVRP